MHFHPPLPRRNGVCEDFILLSGGVEKLAFFQRIIIWFSPCKRRRKRRCSPNGFFVLSKSAVFLFILQPWALRANFPLPLDPKMWYMHRYTDRHVLWYVDIRQSIFLVYNWKYTCPHVPQPGKELKCMSVDNEFFINSEPVSDACLLLISSLPLSLCLRPCAVEKSVGLFIFAWPDLYLSIYPESYMFNACQWTSWLCKAKYTSYLSLYELSSL